MSYTALYRKYRPCQFSDVVGQEHITETLKNQLSSGKIFHAYLFTGSRGTGKTSCAKILASAVNCLNLAEGDPCGECEACRAIAAGEVMDIVEIDAASNNSVDNIRELREQVSFTPANAKYRVYIIDEVHMLTISAFNALLKTLEEPPEHVVFILATTEAHKLPTTILSRCQRFDFKRIDAEKICARIQFVSEKEGFEVTDNAASMIAAIADGGMRDALSILDLCVSAADKIDEDTVARVCGMAGNEYLLRFGQYFAQGDCENSLVLLDQLYNSSVDMLRLLNDLILHYRNLLIVKTVKGDKKPIVCSTSHLKALIAQSEIYEIPQIMSILGKLEDATVKMQAGNRRCEMELVVIRLCTPSLCYDIDSLEMRITALEKSLLCKTEYVNEVQDLPAVQPSQIVVDETPSKNTVVQDEVSVVADGPQKLQHETWACVLKELSKSAPLISGILSDSSAYIHGDFLLIETANAQFAELINGKNNVYREKLRAAIEAVTGNSYKLGPYRKNTADVSDDPLIELKNKLKELEIPGRI